MVKRRTLLVAVAYSAAILLLIVYISRTFFGLWKEFTYPFGFVASPIVGWVEEKKWRKRRLH